MAMWAMGHQQGKLWNTSKFISEVLSAFVCMFWRFYARMKEVYLLVSCIAFGLKFFLSLATPCICDYSFFYHFNFLCTLNT